MTQFQIADIAAGHSAFLLAQRLLRFLVEKKLVSNVEVAQMLGECVQASAEDDPVMVEAAQVFRAMQRHYLEGITSED